MRRTRWILAAGLLAGALALPQAAAAGPKLKSIWGPLGQVPSSQTDSLHMYRLQGVDVVQVKVSWAEVARNRPVVDSRDPDDPAYDWPGDVDRVVRRAADFGLEVLIQVNGAPGWANGGKDARYPPTRDADYANFLRAAWTRWPSVRRWMIWGEPGRPQNWQPNPRNSSEMPRRYAKLLDAAYGALKRRNDDNVIIGANTFTSGTVLPPDMVRWMRLPSGKPPRLDQWGHNPFSRRFPRLSGAPNGKYRDINDVDTLVNEVRAVYSRHRGVRPKLWLSEFTISSDRPNRAFNFYVHRATQADWVRAVFKLANDVPYISGVGWFNLQDEPTTSYSPSSSERGLTTGLIEYDGTRKPAYWQYRRVPCQRPVSGVKSCPGGF